MAKARTQYICEECGARHHQWAGRCETCGAWNSLHEARIPARGGGPAAPQAVALDEVSATDATRLATGMPEFDRVLGGGLVAGSVVLVAGDPGIGKSTLVLQVAAHTAAAVGGCLYVAAEESADQLRLRAARLGLSGEALFVFADTRIESAIDEARRVQAGLIVVDSVQTVRSEAVESAPGTVSQVREATARLVQHAKATHTPVLIVGHVTKEGTVAGPRTLEHMVDAVMYLDGDDYHAHRLLRCVKNRFGPAFEVAVFDLQGDGLKDVPNPSALFLAERDAAAPGSAVAVPMEGTRPLLVEIQALVAPTSYALPRRLATGFDVNRLNLLLAVLGRRAGVGLGAHDVYLNVVGGLRLREPAVDLAVALAIVSSHTDVPAQAGVAAIGEVGLAGELRSVPSIDQRVREARRLGFERCLIPASRNGAKSSAGATGAASLRAALDLALT